MQVGPARTTSIPASAARFANNKSGSGRRYTQDFKDQVLAEIRLFGLRATERKYGLNKATISGWRKKEARGPQRVLEVYQDADSVGGTGILQKNGWSSPGSRILPHIHPGRGGKKNLAEWRQLLRESIANVVTPEGWEKVIRTLLAQAQEGGVLGLMAFRELAPWVMGGRPHSKADDDDTMVGGGARIYVPFSWSKEPEAGVNGHSDDLSAALPAPPEAAAGA